MKGRLFLDTNIVIDYLSKREPFGEEAYALFQSRKEWQLCVSALSECERLYMFFYSSDDTNRISFALQKKLEKFRIQRS